MSPTPQTGSPFAARRETEAGAAAGAERPVLIVIGPTGTGKSEIAWRAAARYGGEVIGCDAIQVYRVLTAGTAKPDPGLRAGIPHHCLDLADPAEDFSLGDYVRAAEAALRGIRGRGCLPVLAGGTGLYLQGLLHGILELPPRRPEIRQRLRRSATRRGTGHLHRLLGRLDPASARRIQPGDAQRILRALEVRLATGIPWSAHLSRWGSRRERIPNVKVGLTRERDRLYRDLDRRVEGFFAAGLVEEVDALLRGGCPQAANSLKAIGYREALRHLQGRCSLSEAIRAAQGRTRRYAKRQWTWFRQTPGVRWFSMDSGLEPAWREIAAWLDPVFAAQVPGRG
ncbi:MAG: tRNA (adenosine(37)-N6)-dimethylallyltransferase MiaA [Acidobacteria bacterium]|nr:tRNA (adenosine(37)-N6)-dimethylallyltransferase MiaA [Acidobacteriota bacterium]